MLNWNIKLLGDIQRCQRPFLLLEFCACIDMCCFYVVLCHKKLFRDSVYLVEKMIVHWKSSSHSCSKCPNVVCCRICVGIWGKWEIQFEF